MTIKKNDFHNNYDEKVSILCLISFDAKSIWNLGHHRHIPSSSSSAYSLQLGIKGT